MKKTNQEKVATKWIKYIIQCYKINFQIARDITKQKCTFEEDIGKSLEVIASQNHERLETVTIRTQKRNKKRKDKIIQKQIPNNNKLKASYITEMRRTNKRKNMQRKIKKYQRENDCLEGIPR